MERYRLNACRRKNGDVVELVADMVADEAGEWVKYTDAMDLVGTADDYKRQRDHNWNAYGAIQQQLSKAYQELADLKAASGKWMKQCVTCGHWSEPALGCPFCEAGKAQCNAKELGDKLKETQQQLGEAAIQRHEAAADRDKYFVEIQALGNRNSLLVDVLKIADAKVAEYKRQLAEYKRQKEAFSALAEFETWLRSNGKLKD